MPLNKETKPKSLAIGLIASLLFFYNDDFGIKWPMKVDMPLNKETKHKLNNFLMIGFLSGCRYSHH